MGLFSRPRHSRGFGIHSPFAYRFLTEVLRDSGMYYGHECLGRRERLLGRLRAFVDPIQLAPLAGVRPVEIVILGPASAFDAELPENTIYYADTRDEAVKALDARLDALGLRHHVPFAVGGKRYSAFPEASEAGNRDAVLAHGGA